MTTRVTWVVETARGVLAFEGCVTEVEALSEAAHEDEDFPANAPHRVIKRTITEEEVSRG